MVPHLRSGLAALALLLASFNATASGTAAASLGDVHFGVLDLTPADGRAAGYDIVSIETSLFAGITTLTADYYVAGYPTPLAPASVHLGLGTAAVSARTNGALADVAATATGDASLGGYGYLGGSANGAVHLMLRPHTVLTIAGHLSTLAERSSAPGEYDDVSSMAYVGIVDEHGYTFTQFIRQSLAYADWPDRMAVEEDFMLAFANGSAVDRPVSVYFQALTHVMRIATPVPEPAAAVLLCAGLLVLGSRAAIARRAR
jgi:hypothetical protein